MIHEALRKAQFHTMIAFQTGNNLIFNSVGIIGRFLIYAIGVEKPYVYIPNVPCAYNIAVISRS